MKKAAVKNAFLLIGILIFIYLIARIGPMSILSALSRMQPVFMIYTVALVFMYLCLQNLKWKMLLSRQGIDLGFWYLMKLYLIGAFYGFITPGKVGTFIRIKYIKARTGKSAGESGVSVILEKALDFVVLFSLAALGLLLLVNVMSSDIIITMALAFAAFFVSLFLVLRKNTSRRIMRVFWRFFVPKSLKGTTRDMFNSFFDNLIDWRGIMLPLAISFAGWICMYSSAYFIALSLGIEVPYQVFILVLPISTIIGMVPITVGGWGIREASWIVLFSIFGVTSDQAMAASILTTLVNYIAPSVIGAFFTMKMEKEKK